MYVSENKRREMEDNNFLNDTATTEIYTLSLHDALPIYRSYPCSYHPWWRRTEEAASAAQPAQSGELKTLPFERAADLRSEEHTSELQSRQYLVCRLLLEQQ